MNNIFKKIITYTISINSYLSEAFTSNMLPNNSFIDKGRTGIGGTTMEQLAPRPSIIIMNRVAAIIDKAKKMNDEAGSTIVLPVYQGHNSKEYIKEYLKNDMVNKKILVTPESFRLVMAAAEELGMSKEITETYFLLVDEQHSYYIDSYREKMLKVFDYFWSFKSKALISATPIIPSDPRFHELDYHKVEFKEPTLKTATVMEATSPVATLRYIISDGYFKDFNLHIFYNSVTGIGEIVNNMQLLDCNIFCAASGRNKEKLGAASKFFKSEPPSKREGYKKVNFYTSKYLESWDMVDKEKAVFIMVTDIYQKHTLLTIKEQLVQWIGRLRNKRPDEIIHVTNHRNTNNIKKREEIHGYYMKFIPTIINGYNASLDVGIPDLDIMKKFIENFAIDIGDGRYQFDHNRFDQVIHKLYSEQMYNHIDLIQREWQENTLYQPIYGWHSITAEELTKETAIRTRTRKQKLKDTIDIIHKAKQDSDNGMYYLSESEWQRCERLYPDDCRIYETLGLDGIEECGYSQSKIRKAMILASAAQTEEKLMMLVSASLN